MAAASPDASAPASESYRALVGAESQDEVTLLSFAPCEAGMTSSSCGVATVRTYEVGLTPSDIEGPHGVIPSRDGKSFYVSLAHGRPFGYLQRYDMASGRLDAQVELGMFPATVDLGPAGMAYVVNFNFDDPDMEPSSLSVVDGRTMTEIARITTCRMPHGSRLNRAGTKHYSGCMMDDLLVEIDTRTLTVARALNVADGSDATGTLGVEHAGHAGMEMPNVCSPTWAEPSVDGSAVYVACNKSHEIVEVDVAAWKVTRRWPTPKTPYNLAVSPDGRMLVATQKGPATTTVWRLSDAKMLAEVPGTRKVASGVAVSADSRYAFVTLEGIGGEPGTVDIIDLKALTRVASLDVGKQAGGIAVLR